MIVTGIIEEKSFTKIILEQYVNVWKFVIRNIVKQLILMSFHRSASAVIVKDAYCSEVQCRSVLCNVLQYSAV